MVFFTCNNCGESLKKATVEKHYNNRKCRGANVSVSCMDCLKDFYGEEYVAHTKCISEKEKYSGKDYVHKESKNSNCKKQESWMEIVRSILDTEEYKLDAKTRAAFERLQSMENVPRKKSKFMNFANNCLRMYKPIMEKVWTVLEKELEKMKEAKATEMAAKKLTQTTDKQTKEEGVVAENGTNEVCTETVSKKKKKKSKDEKNADTDGTEPPKKKSKLNGTSGEEVLNDDVPVTKTKKCKKSKENGVAIDEIESRNADSNRETDDFQWTSVIEKIVAKHSDGITTQKLQKKLLKKYLVKLAVEELTEKQQRKFDKKFGKMLKKCPAVQLDGELAKPC